MIFFNLNLNLLFSIFYNVTNAALVIIAFKHKSGNKLNPLKCMPYVTT